ncbi:hypothetical protein ACQZV8_01490 [Magnetococcales bacterium HHB-1]
MASKDQPPIAVVSIDKDLIDLILQHNPETLIGIFDPTPKTEILGIPVLGDDDQWPHWKARYPLLQGVMALDPPHLRAKISRFFGLNHLASITAPTANISRFSTIKSGCVIQHGVFIGPDSVLGHACKLNIHAAVHHDCHVGDYSVLSPGSRLLGTVTLEEGVYVGSGATVLPNRTVGAYARIGAGAVVCKDVAPGEVVVGIPAKTIQYSKKE